MISMILTFLIGCTLTYLITVLSSAVKASLILEDAMLTYAILMMSAYEVSLKQLEQVIVANEIEEDKANALRRINKTEFATFANKKISEFLKLIPLSHTNIIRYSNFEEMESYITKQYRSKYAKSK